MRDDFAAPRWRTMGHYLRRRRVVFAVAYLGYAACYLVRNNVAVASDILSREHGWTPTQIGSILAGFTLSYGIGKLVMGVVVFYGGLIIAMNLLIDVLYGWFDPRVRYG